MSKFFIVLFQESILQALDQLQSDVNASSALPPISEPSGNGKAFAKFMAIYEYVITEGTCDECPGRFEAMQRMSDPVLTDCPACNESELQRLVSAAAFRLKGSGWYETDFKKGGKKNLHDSGDSGSGASKPGTSEAKSTTKSADTKSASTGPGKGSGEAASKKTDAA